MRFDDEVTRHLFWRNLIDPYAREYAQGCSRWDLLDVVRCTWALRPEGISWPMGEDGRPSFRLTRLTAANGLAHDNAHDALSDVRATIALARLVLVPRVLWLLDEPTVGLDTASLSRLGGIMGGHLDKGGLIIAATHVPLGREPDARLDLGRTP